VRFDSSEAGPIQDYVGYSGGLPAVKWPGDAKLALSIVVNYEEGSERTAAWGDPVTEDVGEVAFKLDGEYRNLHTESIFEYGSRAGIWRVLRILDDFAVPVTFYACAAALEANPSVAVAIREREHEVCGHGWRWEEPWKLSRDEERETIRRAVEVIERLCGERPVGWFSRFCPSVHTRELLVADGGFLYDSNARNDDLPFFAETKGGKMLVLPYTDVYNDSRFILPQGVASPSDFVDLCSRAIAELLREGRSGFPKMMSIGLHPRWIGQPGRASGLREIIAFARAQGDVWFARRRDIATWWSERHGEFEADGASPAGAR